MRVLLSMDGGRGDEPLVGLAVRLRALGAEVRVCAPPDWARNEALARRAGAHESSYPECCTCRVTWMPQLCSAAD